MGQIQDSQLPFNDSATNGNVVDQTAWNQAFQTIKTAVNDNFYRRLTEVQVLNADGTVNTTATLQAASNVTNELQMQMGNGITITPTVSNGTITLQFSVPSKGITASQLADLTITAQQIANSTITATQIANNTITAGQIANNTITETQMAAGSIGTTELQNASVTTAKIANGAVGSTQIASKGVAQSNIADGAVGTNQLDPALLNTTTLNQHRTLNPIDHPDGSVTASKLAYDAVNPTMLQTRVSPNLVDNAHFENVTSTATVFSDALTSYSGSTVPAPWTLQSGSFTFGASGATSGASQATLTAGNLVWKPVLGSDGSIKLALTVQGTVTTPSSISGSYYSGDVQLYQDINNRYIARIDGQESLFILTKVVGGTNTSITTVSQAISVSTSYTITLSLDNTGALTAKLYQGTNTSGTLLQTLTATDTSLTGGFLIGVGGDTGVVISNASVTAPFADGWNVDTGQDKRAAWALTQNPISGKYSLSVVGVPSSYGQNRIYRSVTGLSANTTYTLSGYANTSNLGASYAAFFEFDWTGGTWGAFTTTILSGTNQTERYSTTATSLTGTTGGTLYCTIHDVGTVTFDNIQLEQGSAATPFIPKVQRPATPLDLDPASTVGLSNIVRSLSGGYKVQSGTVGMPTTLNTWTTQSVTFPTAFSSGVIPSIALTVYAGSNRIFAQVTGESNTGFTINLYDTTGSLTSSQLIVSWLAIG